MLPLRAIVVVVIAPTNTHRLRSYLRWFVGRPRSEYTDATFSTLKPVSDRWKHVGIIGPPIRAEVGDTIQVLFRNAIPFPTTLHPHGVFYAKDSEGAVYADGSTCAA